jgi:peptide/nickel transport system permease protein
MLSVGFVFAPYLARLVRAQVLVVKSSLYVDAATGFGASRRHIIVRHILPNAIQPAIVEITLMLAVALLAEASLSFLSLGVQPPAASWGGMLARAYNYLEIAPEQMWAPGMAILLTALAFNALGESMRVLLDPTMKRR